MLSRDKCLEKVGNMHFPVEKHTLLKTKDVSNFFMTL